MRSKRVSKIADVIHHALAKVLHRRIKDPRLLQMSVTAVEVTSDLGTARVFYTVLDESAKPDVEEALKKGVGHIRHLIAGEVSLRHVPQLRFEYDDVIAHAERITHLIDQVVEEDQQHSQDSDEKTR